MKIYNFLFDPNLNNLRLNMDAGLVDPLEKEKNISPEDLDLFKLVDTVDDAVTCIDDFYSQYLLKPNF